MKYKFYLLIPIIFFTGCANNPVLQKELDPLHQRNFNTGMNLIINNIVCYKCETGQWPSSLYEMKNSKISCDTSYLNINKPDGKKANIPDMKFKVTEKKIYYELTVAGDNVDINHLNIKDNFVKYHLYKSKIQCKHNNSLNLDAPR